MSKVNELKPQEQQNSQLQMFSTSKIINARHKPSNEIQLNCAVASLSVRGLHNQELFLLRFKFLNHSYVAPFGVRGLETCLQHVVHQ